MPEPLESDRLASTTGGANDRVRASERRQLFLDDGNRPRLGRGRFTWNGFSVIQVIANALDCSLSLTPAL